MRQRTDWKSTLFHGGIAPSQRVRDYRAAEPTGNFGPGLYGTPLIDVARGYARREGQALYQIEVCGPVAGILNLDRPIRENTGLPQYISRLLRGCERERGGTRYDRLLDVLAIDASQLNSTLLRMGIWMLIGHVGEMSHGGLCDQGPQHVLLDCWRSVTKESCIEGS